MLPKDIAKLVPKTHLMSESEWRNLGVQQSQGWVHYMIHEPEPHILLFRRPLPKKPKKWSWGATFQPQALHSCPHLLTSSWWHYCVAFLFLTLIFKGFSIHCMCWWLLCFLSRTDRKDHSPAGWVSALWVAASAKCDPQNLRELWIQQNTLDRWRKHLRRRPRLFQGLCKLGCFGFFPARCCVYVDLCFSILETFHFIPRNLFHVKSLD